MVAVSFFCSTSTSTADCVVECPVTEQRTRWVNIFWVLGEIMDELRLIQVFLLCWRICRARLHSFHGTSIRITSNSEWNTFNGYLNEWKLYSIYYLFFLQREIKSNLSIFYNTCKIGTENRPHSIFLLCLQRQFSSVVYCIWNRSKYIAFKNFINVHLNNWPRIIHF
jgi:hypothetical protein